MPGQQQLPVHRSQWKFIFPIRHISFRIRLDSMLKIIRNYINPNGFAVCCRGLFRYKKACMKPHNRLSFLQNETKSQRLENEDTRLPQHFQWAASFFFRISLQGCVGTPRGCLRSNSGSSWQIPCFGVQRRRADTVERLYCKRPILCLASSKILTPTARRVCTPRLWCGGWTHLLGGEGVGGQYFGRRQTQLCDLHMKVLCDRHCC